MDESQTWIICPGCGEVVKTRRTHCEKCGTQVTKQFRIHPHVLRRHLRRILAGVIVGLLVAGAVFAVVGLRGSSGRALDRTREEASRLMNGGDHAAATVLWRKVLAAAPDDSAALVNLAVCREAEGDAAEALEILDRVVESSPKLAFAWVRRARLQLRRAGDPRGALDSARAALRVGIADPKQRDVARYIAGVAAFDLGLKDEARRHLMEYRERNPDQLDVLLRLGAIGGEQADRYLRAADRRPRATDLGTPEGRALSSLQAQCLEMAGQADRALAISLAVLERDPGDVSCLERVLRHLPAGQEARVREIVGNAASTEAASAATAGFARWLARQGRLDEGLELLGDPEEPGLFLARLDLLLSADRAGEVIEEIGARPEGLRSRAEVRLRRVHALRAAGRAEDAVEAVAELISREAGRIDLLLDAAGPLVSDLEKPPRTEERRAAAGRLLDLLAGIAPAETSVRGMVARLQLILGRAGEAEKFLEGLEASPDPQIQAALLALDVRRGILAPVLEGALRRRDRMPPELRLRAARLALRLRRPEDALTLCGPAATDEERMEVRARALSALGRLDEAEASLREAKRGGLVVRHAELLARLGRTEAAEERLSGATEAEEEAWALRTWWRLQAGGVEAAAAYDFGGEVPEACRSRVALAIAERIEEAGRSAEGIEWLRRAEGALRGDPDVTAALALAEIARGLDRPETVALRPTVLRLAAEHPECDALRLAAAAYSLLEGDLRKARRVVDAALAARPLDIDARRLAAFTDIREKRFPEARRHLECVLSLRPRDPATRGLVKALDVMEAQHRLDVGEEAALPGSALEPGVGGRVPRAALKASVREGLGRGDLEQAAAAFARLGLGEDAAFLTRFDAVDAALAKGEVTAALEAARPLATLRPRSPLARLTLGVLALEAGEEDLGLSSLAKAVELAPGWGQARVRYTRALVDRDRRAEALSMLEDRLASRPSDPVCLALVAELRLSGGDPAAAKAFAERALGIGGADAIAREVLLRIAEKEGRPALPLVRSWIERGGADPDLDALAGHVALAAGETEEAERGFRAALDLDRDHVEANVGMAEICVKRGKTTLALDHARRAQRGRPLDPGLGVLTAGLLRLSGDRAGAARTLTQVLRLRPDHPLAALNLAWIVAEQGAEPERAVALAETALAGMPGAPEALDTLGFALLRAGRAADAADRLSEAVEAGAALPSRVRLARALDEAGRTADAIARYRGLLENPVFAGREEIAARLAELTEGGEK